MRSGNYKRSYAQLVALADNTATWVWSIAGAVALLTLPIVAGNYVLSLVTLTVIMAIAVLGLNLLSGVAGQLSLGHSAFLLIGAYTQAILTVDHGVHGLLALLLSGAVAALFSLVVGVPSLRLKGLYLAVTTLAFAFIMEHVVLIAEDVTRGSSGMPVPALDVFGMRLSGVRPFYYVCALLLLVFVLCTLNLMRSRVGRAWNALHHHDIAAVAMGINVVRYKLTAFMVSAFYAGVAGALMALHFRYINVENFGIVLSIELLAMMVVGGMGRTHGALLGAALLAPMPELIRIAFQFGGDSVESILENNIYEVRALMYGVVILLFLRLEPEGLAGIWRKSKRFWVHWPLSQ
ncbi:MAG: branched-chain amino acid ABC transporter permease [Proteobacteria bacterium]|nr:MAG: branched-chain amino acid ABC transporter permease [Pseudomonadota bacterium]